MSALQQVSKPGPLDGAMPPEAGERSNPGYDIYCGEDCCCIILKYVLYCIWSPIWLIPYMPAAPIAAGGNISDIGAATAPKKRPSPDKNRPKSPGIFCCCANGSSPETTRISYFMASGLMGENCIMLCKYYRQRIPLKLLWAAVLTFLPQPFPQ